jgi:hypothetical protein
MLVGSAIHWLEEAPSWAVAIVPAIAEYKTVLSSIAVLTLLA